jgi:hypothetical protein
MKILVVFIAGAMFLSTGFASDPGSEARFKMKTGRYTPGEEARREASGTAAKEATGKSAMNCDLHGCCPHSDRAVAKTAVSSGDPGSDARFQLKFGQHSPEVRMAGARQATSEPVLAASAHRCEGDCCKHGE